MESNTQNKVVQVKIDLLFSVSFLMPELKDLIDYN